MTVPGKSILRGKVVVLYHLFYEDTVLTVAEDLRDLRQYEPAFFFNISSAMPGAQAVGDTLRAQFPGCFITFSSNKGKDIGAKLLLLKLFIEDGSEAEWIIFLHDKKSLQAVNARTWRSELFSVIRQEKLSELEQLVEDGTVGIAAPGNYVRKESEGGMVLEGNNGVHLLRLTREYDIHPPTYDFVAGSIFWVRASALIPFFKKHDPLEIRLTLEEGNVIDNFEGTLTHSWERLLSWIVTSNSMKIKTI